MYTQIKRLNTYISHKLNHEKVEPGSFRLVDLCLNHLALLYLNISWVTRILNVYGFIGSNSLDLSIIHNFHFWHSLTLYSKRTRCDQVEASPCYS